MAHQDHYPPPDPRYLKPHHPYNAMPDLEPSRSRGDSIAQDGYASDSSRYSKARQPINDAVNSAFTNSSATAGALSPELLHQLTSQITANVIQQLKATNITAPQASPSIQPDQKSSVGGSPPLDRATVYTPPSPYPPPDTQRSPPKPGLGVDMSAGSPPPPEKRPTPPPSYSSQPEEDPMTRPKGPQRISTGGDMTVVEKIWGTLFDEQGEATPRLGQLLRGIAMHLIEDYEPKHSIVVTPAKLQQYYQETKLDYEPYPWKDIFDDRTSSISRMFRDLEVQHHLVQEKLSERPDIPCLTPQGFERWYTLMIRAHPDQEFERLAKTALDMPVSNPDNRSERFPKEISRRLFPRHGDREIEAKLCKVMSVHCNLNLKSRHNSSAQPDPVPFPEARASNASMQPPANGATSTPRDSAENAGGRPHSFSSASASGPAVVSDSDDTPTPQPIERERKPYVAQPGGGKNFDNINAPTSAAATDLKPPGVESKLKRSTSNRESRPRYDRDDYTKSRPAPISVHQHSGAAPLTSAPIEIPESRSRHRNSAYYRDPPPLSSTNPPRRTRSPSISKSSARQSEPQDIYNYPAPGSSVPSDIDRDRGSVGERDREKRYRDYETQRERLAGDRYDAARMSAYDPRDRERERKGPDYVRPRGQSVGYGVVDDEYYRGIAGGAYPPPPSDRLRDPGGSVGGGGGGGSGGSGVSQYPPSSYR
jgi:hypothetical protein